MVRHTDMEKIAIKEEIYAKIPRNRRCVTPGRKYQAQSGGRRSWQKMWIKDFFVVSNGSKGGGRLVGIISVCSGFGGLS